MSMKPPEQSASSRRGFFRLAGATIAGLAAGSLTSRDQARAADGDGLKLGQSNVAGTKTELTTTGTIVNDGALVVSAPNAEYGIQGSAKSIGVYGQGPIGVYGDGAVGGVFSGTDAAISLTPRALAGPPSGSSLKGDMLVDADGVLWICIREGAPGTWIQVSHGGIRPLAQPQRVYDSRLTGGQFEGYSTRTIDVVGANVGVPAQAVAIAVNLTVTETNDDGFLSAYPAGNARPITTNVNWAPYQTIANAATIRLGTNGQIALYVERSRAQVIVDLTGYVL